MQDIIKAMMHSLATHVVSAVTHRMEDQLEGVSTENPCINSKGQKCRVRWKFTGRLSWVVHN